MGIFDTFHEPRTHKAVYQRCHRSAGQRKAPADLTCRERPVFQRVHAAKVGDMQSQLGRRPRVKAIHGFVEAPRCSEEFV